MEASVEGEKMSAASAWACLAAAGCLEIVWVFTMKGAEGFTKLGPSLITLSVMAVSFFLLSQSLRVIPIGTAYAVWTGIGAVGAAIGGILLFHEPASAVRLLCILMVVGGIAGLKIFS